MSQGMHENGENTAPTNFSQTNQTHPVKPHFTPTNLAFWSACFGMIGLIGLIVSEIMIVGAALVWSFSGLLDLGQTTTLLFSLCVSTFVIWASLWVVKAAFHTEFGGR